MRRAPYTKDGCTLYYLLNNIIYIDYRAFFYFDTNKKFSKSAGHSLVFLKKLSTFNKEVLVIFKLSEKLLNVFNIKTTFLSDSTFVSLYRHGVI